LYKLNKLTLQDILLQGATNYGENPALSMLEGQPVSYAGILSRARHLASVLASQGVNPGDRVALLSENRVEWGIAYFAIASMGAVVVPILTEFSAPQVAHILEHAGCKAVVLSPRYRDRAGGEIAVIDIDGVTLLRTAPGAVRSSVTGPFPFPEVAEDDLAAILYTSGTTGQSKGVMLTHRNIVANAQATRTILAIEPTDRLLSILPLAHTYECTLGLVGALLQGGHVYYLDRPPTASALLPAMARIRPTIMITVPLVIEKIFRSKVLPELAKHRAYSHPLGRRVLHYLAGMKLKKTFGGCLRFFGIGGASLGPDVERFLFEARFPYAIGYGLTETAPLVAGCASGKGHPGAVGPVLSGVDIRLTEGEIQVRGPNVMRGYYKDPERTREAFTKDGWFRTGDLGHVDAHGRLAIRGRIKTMILGASGENIYPEEIEAVLNQSAYVGESLVYGDAKGVAALVVLKPEVAESFAVAVHDGIAKAERSAAELLERIRMEVNANLAAFSRLVRVELQTVPFEKTPTQKIKRFLYPRRGFDA